MEYELYQLKTIANTHAGGGQTSYGVVDNIVQRDYLSQLPCFNSTSLKGALREWVEQELKEKDMAKSIFGSPNEKDDAAKVSYPGTHHFFQAFLVSYPMRSDIRKYFNVTSPCILEYIKGCFDNFGIAHLKAEIEALLALGVARNEPVSLGNINQAIIERHDIRTVNPGSFYYSDDLKKMFGDNLALMHDDDFNDIVKKLPVITRNNLENGQSTNLFYEEVVPRETHFGFIVGFPKDLTVKLSALVQNKKIVQIGANATVGYGFCELSKI